MSEWFNGTHPHLTPSLYAVTRNAIVDLYNKDTTKYLAAGDVTNTVAGEPGSLLRLWRALEAGGAINHGSIRGDSLPVVLPASRAAAAELARKVSALVGAQIPAGAGGEEAAAAGVDWSKVAEGAGVGREEAVRAFLGGSEEEYASAGGGEAGASGEGGGGGGGGGNDARVGAVKHLLDSLDSNIVQAAVDAALAAGASAGDARKAGALGGVAGAAALTATRERDEIASLHREIVDLEHKKWELKHRRLLDMEEVLEAERRSLLIERRDGYYKRCRYWLGE